MLLGLFKKQYVVRQYSQQVVIDGYPSSPYTDVQMRLNVQPLNSDELRALPEGERTVKRLKSFGQNQLTSANEFTGTPGDRLFYCGYWHECKSSIMWDHTMLGHYRSEFVILPRGEQEPSPIVTDA